MSTTRPAQEAESLSDLHLLVREALSEALGGEVTGRCYGRTSVARSVGNWDVSGNTPTKHRDPIDGLRGRYPAAQPSPESRRRKKASTMSISATLIRRRR